jgi:hypothetical protein
MIDKKTLIGIVLLILIVIMYFLYTNLPNDELEKDGRFTLLEIVKIETHPDTSPIVNYEFYVNNKVIKGKCLMDIEMEDRNVKEKSKYIVKYLPRDPNIHKILYDKNAPENLEAPIKGWKNIPE